MNPLSHTQKIRAHYARCWQPPEAAVRLSGGRIHELPADFHVLRIPRGAMVAYATEGMSVPTDAEPLELHMFCRQGQPGAERIVELLTAVAHFHRTRVRLSLGHTVNFGIPWLDGAGAEFGLVSLPYLDGPSFEWLSPPGVRFLWLIPVTKAEVEFKKQHGLDALETRFEAAAFDYLDPFRRSVV